jgi:uncharacterized protein (DUF608 family)
MQPTPGIRIFNSSHSALAFPLGGIGTGNVSLGARGDLRDWEIFNRPAKGQQLPNTFFALRTQIGTQAPQTRVLEGPIQPPHTLSHGYHPTTYAGLPRLSGTTFYGEYPFATIDFASPELPVDVQLEAYTPLIPLNPDDSGIPCAILTFTLKNTATEAVKLTLVGSLANATAEPQTDVFGNIQANKSGQNVNEFREDAPLRGLYFYSLGMPADHLAYGSMALITDHPQVTVKPAWLRGAWYDYLREFWDDLVEDGLLTDLGYNSPSADRRPDTGSLGLLDTLQPGETKTYRFILTWHFPNRVNSWDVHSDKVTRNHYVRHFENAWDVGRYVIREFERLDSGTRQFHAALFGSTLPAHVIDAVSANIVPVRSNTCFWLEDGRFFGWEGCFDHAGCCAGSCTHVWSYTHTAAFLFPSLERTMRDIEFLVETEDDGYMSFRNFRAFNETFVWHWGDQKPEAAVDGQMGSILRTYREWQLSADREWLARIWPAVVRAVDFASAHWDSDKDQVLDGRQHNTYDIEFYGPNPLSSIYYLAALRAVEEMAQVMQADEVARRCRAAFEKGSQNLDTMLWNGEFYIQKLDDVNAYKYQHGIGCLSDQLLGQLHARVFDLGDLLPAEHIRTAIKAIFDHNFRTSFHDHVNCQRTYVLNDEAGLILCTWPNGGQPRFPFVYSDEVWTGIEYQVAAHLIYEGWLEEGLTLVQAVRERHDGLRRNPWNEVECGHHYSRSMSSWAILLALSGAHCDLGKGELRFNPVVGPDDTYYRTFWSSGRAWGTLTLHRSTPADSWQSQIEVLGGSLEGVQVKIDMI